MRLTNIVSFLSLVFKIIQRKKNVQRDNPRFFHFVDAIFEKKKRYNNELEKK